MGVQLVDSDLQEPLAPGTVGLFLRRSSSALRGLRVHPGVIDPDYSGVIKIMVESPKGASNIFTDGSKTIMGAYMIDSQAPVQHYFSPGAPQNVELLIVIEVFKACPFPFNLISDSCYVINAVNSLECAGPIKSSSMDQQDPIWVLERLLRKATQNCQDEDASMDDDIPPDPESHSRAKMGNTVSFSKANVN
ncbi:hypothetical protein STEG23_035239 [Scotinomys teguina]